MLALLKSIRPSFGAGRKKATPEQEILFNRVVMGSVAALICYTVGFDPRIVFAFVAYLTLNAGLMIMERASIFQPEKRWLAAIILDVAMATSTMLIDAEGMSWAYAVVLRMVLGNGFRFGLKWLAVASIFAAVGFGIVVATTAFWQQNAILGYSLVAGLIVIPSYCSTLIKKISYAKDQAETASRAKSYFLASVSHELRTPLNAILGYGNHLRQMGLPTKQHNMIDASVMAAEHLLHLIEQLIQVAKAETGAIQVSRSEFKTTDILKEVRDIMAVQAREKGIELRLQAEPLCDQIVDGPADTIRNILLNLTGNAIKFTDSGAVSISCTLEKIASGHQLSMHVTDTGIGIAQDAQTRIFQPFQQADDSVMDRFGGTGLGLAICKQLAEHAGGSIEVSSTVGHGSNFHVIIPVTTLVTDVQNEENDTLGSVKIVSFGIMNSGLLTSAQSAGNYIVKHVECLTVDDLRREIANGALQDYRIALIHSELAQLIEPDDQIWKSFVEAQVAPVLVQDQSNLELEDVTLRAAFASVIPSSPDFQTLRSAVRIGCSFAKHPFADKFGSADSVEAVALKPMASRSVLVADDNRTNRNVLAAILESAGHNATMVTDGDEALEALELGGFDILLLDVNMPRLNGIDTASMWRQIEGGRSHLPIIGVTADATTETEDRCLAAGMDLRITKPFDAKRLLALIDDYTSGDADSAEIQPENDPFEVVVPFLQTSDDDLSAIDHLQLDYLLSIGDQSFVDEMISSFQADIEETIGLMRAAVGDNDVQKFRFCAHAFKSSAQNLGATDLVQISAKLEHITEGEFSENGQLHLGRIEKSIAKIERALANPNLQSHRAVNQ
jgi:two-component system sensor histidine kinase RpfC